MFPLSAFLPLFCFLAVLSSSSHCFLSFPPLLSSLFSYSIILSSYLLIFSPLPIPFLVFFHFLSGNILKYMFFHLPFILLLSFLLIFIHFFPLLFFHGSFSCLNLLFHVLLLVSFNVPPLCFHPFPFHHFCFFSHSFVLPLYPLLSSPIFHLFLLFCGSFYPRFYSFLFLSPVHSSLLL